MRTNIVIVTVSSGIDVLIAAFCIEREYALPHRDRVYSGFAQRGLHVRCH